MISRRGFFASTAIAATAAAIGGVHIATPTRRFSFPVDNALLNDMALYTSREVVRRLPQYSGLGPYPENICIQVTVGDRYTWSELVTRLLDPVADTFAFAAGRYVRFCNVQLRSPTQWARVLHTADTVPLLIENDGDRVSFRIRITPGSELR